MKKTMKRYIFLPILLIFIILLVNLTSFIMYPYLTIDHPYLQTYKTNDDEIILSSFKDGHSSYVELKDVSQEFISTLISIEDKNFYSHNGFDYLRIIKSAYTNIVSNEIKQGASTITQQVARLIYLNNEKTYKRKIKEALLTMRLERIYSKDFILEIYINSTYFAHGIYGLKTASDYYFNKDPKDLNYQESCLLVGIINGPNIYSPFIDIEASKNKMKEIAFSLLKNNVIDTKIYYEIISNKINLSKQIIKERYNYYLDAVKKELENKKIADEKHSSIGLNITTYLDAKIQNTIEKIASSYKLEDEISIVVMKPYSGHVMALIGGKDYTQSSFNRALDSKRQIGSTIKPLIYYTAFKNGLTPLSEFTSEPTSFVLPDGSTYSPKNSNNIYANRKINMIEAIGMSDNIYALKTVRTITLNKLLDTLKLFGIEVENPNLTIGLGNLELTPLQLTSIYNTFASEGRYYTPTFIKKVTTHNNTIKFSNTNSSKEVLSPQETIMLNYLLQAPFDKALSTYASPTMKNYQVKNTFSVKTGTTFSTSWTVGYSKDFTVTVYVGDDQNNALNDGTVSKKIWRDIVNELTKDIDDDFYTFMPNYKPFKLYNPTNGYLSKTYIKKVSN